MEKDASKIFSVRLPGMIVYLIQDLTLSWMLPSAFVRVLLAGNQEPKKVFQGPNHLKSYAFDLAMLLKMQAQLLKMQAQIIITRVCDSVLEIIKAARQIFLCY